MVLMAIGCGTLSASEPSLMDRSQNEAYRKALPSTKDERLLSIISDKHLMFYTDNEIPKAHQDWEGSLQGILDSRGNVSANRTEPFGNGNKEFPWGAPAGTHLSNGVTSIRFLLLPRDEHGSIYPVVYYQIPKISYGKRTLPDGTNISADERFYREGWAWTFPKGTIVGEVLMISDSRGNRHVFEIRTRSRSIDRWAVNVYRPFPTANDLLIAVKKLDNWEKNAKLRNLVTHLEGSLSSDHYTLADTQPDKSVFKQIRQQDFLPAIDEDVAITLLHKTPFSSSLDVVWRGDGEYAPHAPTTEADFHIVPKRYAAGFINVTTNSCMQCHKETNQHVHEFDIRRDWYGRIRGSDGIFSFHPFDHGCITQSGGQPVSFNKKMIDAGIIAPFDPSKHSNAVYQRIVNVR